MPVKTHRRHKKDFALKNQANFLACAGLVDQISRVKSSPNLAQPVPSYPKKKVQLPGPSPPDDVIEGYGEDGMAAAGRSGNGFEDASDGVHVGDDGRDHIAGAEEVMATGTPSSEEDTETNAHSCLCETHPGKLYLNLIINKPAEEVFQLLFSNSDFFQNIQRERNTKSMVMSEWRSSSSISHSHSSSHPPMGKKRRVLSYIVEISSPLGTKSAPTTEKQTLLRSNKHKSRYVIECEVTNSGVPYSDSYYVICLYCITQTVKHRQCRLTVHCHIGYKKSVFSLVKNIIEKNCQSGLQDYFKFLGSKLILELRAKSVCKEVRQSVDGSPHRGSPRKSTSKIQRDSKKKSHARGGTTDGDTTDDPDNSLHSRTLGNGSALQNDSDRSSDVSDNKRGAVGEGLLSRLSSSFGRRSRKRHISTTSSYGRRYNNNNPAIASSSRYSTTVLYLLLILLCAHTTFLQYKLWNLERFLGPSPPSQSMDSSTNIPFSTYFSINQTSFASFIAQSLSHLSWITLPFRVLRNLTTSIFGLTLGSFRSYRHHHITQADADKGITLLSELLKQMEKSIMALEQAYNQTHLPTAPA